MLYKSTLYLLLGIVTCVQMTTALPQIQHLTLNLSHIDPKPFFNPSIIKLRNGTYLGAFRQTDMVYTNTTDLWITRAFLCSSQTVTFAAASCQLWDPRPHGSDRECMWTADGRWKTEATGIEDVKLLEWPDVGKCACISSHHSAIAHRLRLAQVQLSTNNRISRCVLPLP